MKCQRCDASLKLLETTADTYELVERRYECRGKEHHPIVVQMWSVEPRVGVRPKAPGHRVGTHFAARPAGW